MLKYTLGVLLAVGFSCQAAVAGVTYASEGGKTIRVGYNNSPSIMDLTGDGIPEIGQSVLSKVRLIQTPLTGANAATLKVKEINYIVPRLVNPTTGVGISLQGGTHVLVYGQGSGIFPWPLWGFGTFSQAGATFAVDMRSVDTGTPITNLAGKILVPDASLSVIIWNGTTGRRARQFSIQSGANWQLIPSECGFVDTDGNGTVEFVERWEKRTPAPTLGAVPPPAGTVITSRGKTMWVIWNSTRTRRMKTVYVNHVDQQRF